MKQRIAIVGAGGIFPAAATLDNFWENIGNARDCTREPPAGRWQVPADVVYQPGAPVNDRVYSRRACFVEDFTLDPGHLAIDPDRLAGLDPMFHLLLHAGREAWLDAVTDLVDRDRCGIIIGNIALPTGTASAIAADLLLAEVEQRIPGIARNRRRTALINGHVTGLPAGLLADALELGGATWTLDAACASSLYALKYAVDELQSGRADAMLCGGLSRPDPLYTQMGFSALHALSASGHCSPFDQKGDGLVVGEGCGMLVLKRLSDALQHGDHIYATVAGTGLSNDISGNLMSPDSEGQLRAMQAAYREANWHPADVDLIECHGTGTPVGDAVEFNSLVNLWQDAPAGPGCIIGSVKSNIGHLLTAAGSAGLIKVLLAMKHRRLPPTANFEAAPDNMALDGSPFTVLQQSREWNRRQESIPRRAAISAFGFGGINAHVLLEEWDPALYTEPAVTTAKSIHPVDEVAIVGLAVHAGPCGSLEEFTQSYFDPGADPGEPPVGTIDAVTVPLGKFRIPPSELQEMLPQQLLMLLVASNALDDAAISDPEQMLQAGVFIGIALDFNTTNFHLRWDLLHRTRTWLGDVTDEQTQQWINGLADSASPPLTANRTMGSLGGIVASRIARAFGAGGPGFTVSSEQASGLQAVQTAVRSLQRYEINTAIAGAVDFAGDERMTAVYGQGNAITTGDAAVALVLKRHRDAVRDGDRVYALIKGCGNSRIDTETAMITAMKDAAVEALPCYRPAALAPGYGVASGLLSLLATTLTLYNRLLPRTEPGGVRYWLRDRLQGPRCAVTGGDSIDGNRIGIVLQEPGSRCVPAQSLPQTLVSITADDREQMLAAIDVFAGQLQKTAGPISAVARTWWQNSDQSGRLALTLLARDREDLYAQLQRGRAAVTEDRGSKSECVYYSPSPLAATGKLAFVFPGSGNHYHGMGREASTYWPQILDRLDAENGQLCSQFAQACFWSDDTKQAPGHEAVIFGQVWLGTFISDIISSYAVRPQAVIGYSLGETAGLFASRTWKDRDLMLQRMQSSRLFSHDLAGPCDAVRDVWGMADDSAIDWQIGMVNRSAAEVQDALSGRQRVYLLIINTPQECVIGGDSAAVQELVHTLNCQFHPIDGVTTVHCEVVMPVADAYRDLHLFETTPPQGVDFYSGIRGGVYPVTRDSAADSIVGQALQYFDYTRVINNAWDDGVRLFVEMGPGNSCSRMIGEILGDREHAAMAACTRGKAETESILGVLARLNSERVVMDLADLYRQQPEATVQADLPVVSIPARRGPVTVPDTVPVPQLQRTGEDDLVTMTPDAATVLQHPATQILGQMQQVETAHARAQQAYLQVANGINTTMGEALSLQLSLLHAIPVQQRGDVQILTTGGNGDGDIPKQPQQPVALDRDLCMEFATGSIASVLGPYFAAADGFPTRVRLPDEPLMLVDRVMTIEAEPGAMDSGRVITEHDVKHDAWYLDGGRIPTCIAVEAGQADLFLSAYLGIDLQTRGMAVYRLLDAEVTFHGPLPRAGQVIRYDIHIDHFFRQGSTWLFRFHFDGTVDDNLLITMRNGCAGFFTAAELDAGKGIVQTAIETREQPGKRTGGWIPFVAMENTTCTDSQLEALRAGDLAGCFGPAFAGLPLERPAGLPGGRMKLVHRIVELDPDGGRFGLGSITGEADISPGDWFLTCHFVDDQVMPGTLMYECCLHTLRVYLLRIGWVGEADTMVYEPVTGVAGKLKCRGQVTADTKQVRYAISVKEIGYNNDGIPYVIADALMSADGRPIVQMTDMSLQLSNLRRQELEAMWLGDSQQTGQDVLFDYDSIHAFATGKPSMAFGSKYRVFDTQRVIARLPGPPYQFLDRIVSIRDCEQWELRPGGVIEAKYDIPGDAWYFTANRQEEMPFSVLLEVALQPCGWLAAYLGSALTSDVDLSFRNLGGKAVQSLPVTASTGTLTTEIAITAVSQSGGMIIQNYDFCVRSSNGTVYQGDTYFGFFSREALANQVGLRDASPWIPDNEGPLTAETYPETAPYPDSMMRMLDRIEYYDENGGPHGFGFIRGKADVNPDAWFFRAHFYQDPVWPGSLGLESFIQLLKYVAYQRWFNGKNPAAASFQSPLLNTEHSWVYRGQILPVDKQVTVQAVITDRNDREKSLRADGFLQVDGRIIYQINDFTLRMSSQ